MIRSRSSLCEALAAAGCVAAAEEADELLVAAAGDEGLLESMLQRRTAGEPLAWITGHIRFCGVDILVHPGVYVPRLQSEPLVRRAAQYLRPGGTAVDLCTGSGALAIALSRLVPGARVLATELAEGAVACARENGVETYAGDLDAPLPTGLDGKVDVLLAVVPYVPTSELRFLPRDVQEYEPVVALDGGTDGLTYLRRAARAAARLLAPDGVALYELGGEEADLIAAELPGLGLDIAEVLLDEEGDPRGVEIRRAPRA